MKFLYKINEFMKERYGIDELYKFLLWFYIIVFLVNLFLKSIYLTYFELFIIIFAFYRVFSKNKRKRFLENERYLKVKKFLISPFNDIKRNYKDRKEYIYKKCFSCKTVLRLPLPYERGIKVAKCPTCKKRIRFLCLRKQKIEIIKN